MWLRRTGLVLALLFFLSGAAFAWFVHSSEADGGALSAGQPGGELELWMQLPGPDGSFAPVDTEALAALREGAATDALRPLAAGGGTAFLDCALRPGELLARRLLLYNRRPDARAGFRLRFPASNDAPSLLADALQISVLRVDGGPPAPQLDRLDGNAFHNALLYGVVPPESLLAYEFQFACAGGGVSGGSYRSELVLDACGSFSGLYAAGNGGELLSLLDGGELQNGDTVFLCGDADIPHLITDRAFNLLLEGYALHVEGAFAVNRPLDGGEELFATMEVSGGRLQVDGALPVLRDGEPASVRFSLDCPGVAVRWDVSTGSDVPGRDELNVRAFNGVYGGTVSNGGLGAVSVPTE